MAKKIKKGKRLDGKYYLIGIDPGKVYGFAIGINPYPAIVSDPKQVIVRTGRDKETTFGAKMLIVEINEELAKLGYNPLKDTLLIMCENPMGSNVRAIGAIKAQLGSVAYAFDSNECDDPEDPTNYDQVIRCLPSAWKVHMRECGLVEGLSGTVGANNKSSTCDETGEKTVRYGYLPLINKRFKKKWTEDEASAFSILQYMHEIAFAVIDNVEYKRAKKEKRLARELKKSKSKKRKAAKNDRLKQRTNAQRKR